MTFIETVPPEEAAGLVAELYAGDEAAFGHVANFTRTFSAQPEVYAAWKQLNGAIKAGMDLRRYELATLAAARRLRSSYCMLAHGSVLAEQFMAGDAVRHAATDRSGLDELDVAVMELAEQVAGDATAVTQADIDRLRALGLPDAEILGVVLAAAARCFFSKALDATGTLPDAKYADMEPALRDALTVGRPIATA
jgi:alkylhydroperoxidase family enzyme